MEEMFKQELEFYSNHQFTLPDHRKLNIPRYERNTSFSELSNWTNSDKFMSSKLPKIHSRYQLPTTTNKIEREHSLMSSPCCPIKQMDINLEPLKNLEDSYYCQYLKSRNKNTVRQIQMLALGERQKRRANSKGEAVSVGKLRQIIKRQKNSRFNVEIEDYLTTTQLFKNGNTKKVVK